MDQVFILVIEQSTKWFHQRNTMVFSSYEKALKYFDKAAKYFSTLPEYNDRGYHVNYHRDCCGTHMAIKSVSDSKLYYEAYISAYDVDDTIDKPNFMGMEDD